MKRNEAVWDRMIRVVLGAGLVSLVFLGPQSVWGIVGILPLATGLSGYCPLYQLLGFSTCPLASRG